MSESNYDSTLSKKSETTNKSTPTGSKIKKFDHLFKIVLIGDSGVGKSCLLLRFADDQFCDNFYSTIGVDFRFKCITVAQKDIKLQIWDTAGQERFKTITSAYYRGADGIIIVYDQTDKNSFWHLNEWLSDIEKFTTDNPIKMVLANKSDLSELIEVTQSDSKEFSNKTGIEIIETSAKNSYQVEHAFEKMTKLLIERSEKNKSETVTPSHKLTPLPIEGRLKDKANKCCKY